MPVSVMLVFVLPCTVVGAAFAFYFSLMWYCLLREAELQREEKATPEQGLSEAELEKLPKLTGKDLVMEPECAICLEQIKSDQPARLLPGLTEKFKRRRFEELGFRSNGPAALAFRGYAL
uniref:Uncharacterized protein n=1 Tax=Vitis vinifera TaxID=29760 RepID=A5BML0_VITVI|nr:hypothetical protein VITISV_008413 [Vitis vinifera]